MLIPEYHAFSRPIVGGVLREISRWGILFGLSYQPCSGGTLLLLRGAVTKWQKAFKPYSFWHLEFINKVGLLSCIQCLSVSQDDLYREECSLHWLQSAWSERRCSHHKHLAWRSSAPLGAACTAGGKHSFSKEGFTSAWLTCSDMTCVQASLSLHWYIGNLEQYPPTLDS